MTTSSRDLWLADLRRTLEMWRTAPALPVVGLVVALLMFAPQAVMPLPAGCGVGTHPACTSGSQPLYTLLYVLALPVSLFTVGLFGAERWWYAMVSSGDVPRAGALWGKSGSYFWRFVRLGLLVALLSAPVVVPIVLATRHNQGLRTVAVAAVVLVLDVALTFVTPVMALSTDSAWQAVKTGLAALTKLWPRDAYYALVPPMALTILTRVAPDVLGSRTATALIGAVAQLLTMFFAGAVVLLYLRELDPGAVERLRQGRPATPPPLYAAAPGE